MKNTVNVTEPIIGSVWSAFFQSLFFAKNRIMLAQYPVATEKKCSA
jgi:hypothetical protein